MPLGFCGGMRVMGFLGSGEVVRAGRATALRSEGVRLWLRPRCGSKGEAGASCPGHSNRSAYGALVQISPVDPLDVDLALAERISELDQLSRDDAGVQVPAASGPSRLTFLQHGNDGRPVDGFWVAGPVDKPYGWGMVGMPWRDNLGAANLRAGVHPDHRDQGIGAALLQAAVDLAVARGRTRMFTGAWQGSVACRFLERHGFSVAGQQPYAVRRLDCDDP